VYGAAGWAAGPVKWTERFIARAQHKSDLRAERFRRHEEGVRAGTEPRNLMERMESSMTLSQERFRTQVRFQIACANERLINPGWPSGAPPYDASLGLPDAWRTWVTDRPIRGPDGVAVTIWVRRDDQDLPFHDPPYDQGKVTWQELVESQKTYTVCVRRTPAWPTRQFRGSYWATQQFRTSYWATRHGSPTQFRSFVTETSARWYAVELARAVRQSGITWVRLSDMLPDRSRPARSERILAAEIVGGSRGSGHRLLRLSQRARARWRQVRTGRR
jgi:hypothetical protein